MKIAYIIPATYNSGGMERILTHKANYLNGQGFEITIITTDQCGRAPFFTTESGIRHHDLGVNISECFGRSVVVRAVLYRRKQRLFRRVLTEFLNTEKFDVVVSMFGAEVDFLYRINDGSRKVLELHFSKYFRLHMSRSLLERLGARYRIWRNSRTVLRYDRFVVLTEQDRANWGLLPNIEVIYNSCDVVSGDVATLHSRRAIAVGRLDYQKGYEYMIDCWAEVVSRYPDWVLDVYGGGELREDLEGLILRRGLCDSVRLCGVSGDIEGEILDSSVYLLSSRSEGLPMVLLESMSLGVPCVSFSCECGPRDVISDGEDGYLVDFGDVGGMADRVCRLIGDFELRRSMGFRAVEKVRGKFSVERVMGSWVRLFRDIV